MSAGPGGREVDIHNRQARKGVLARWLSWLRMDPARSAKSDVPVRQQGDYNPDTVEALVEQARYHASFEESRLTSAQQRASWLLAFDGLLIGLAASQSHALLSEARALGAVGRPLAAISLVGGTAFVLCSALLALTVIFRAKSWLWAPEEISGLPSPESVRQPRAEVQGSFLVGLTQRIGEEGKAFEKLSRRLEFAFAVLAVGLATLSISIGVYAVRTVQNPCPSSITISVGSSAEAVARPQAALMLSERTGQFVADTEPPLEIRTPFKCPKGGPGKR